MQAPFGALGARQRRRLGSQGVAMAFGKAELGHLLEAVVGWVGRLVRCHFCDAALVTLPLQLVVVVGARGLGVQFLCGQAGWL